MSRRASIARAGPSRRRNKISKAGDEPDKAKENGTRQGYPEKQRLTAILDVLLPSAVIIDPDRHRIVYANAQAAAVAGCTCQQAIGRQPWGRAPTLICHRVDAFAAKRQDPLQAL